MWQSSSELRRLRKHVERVNALKDATAVRSSASFASKKPNSFGMASPS